MINEEIKSQNQEEETISLEDLWRLFISKWYWFATSLVCCLFIAIIYILTATPIYTRNASLLIKDDSKNRASGMGNMDAFENLGFLKSNTNINNEMLTIQAPVMMEEVVNRLRLDITMKMEDGLHTRTLYNDAPVNILLNNIKEDQTLSFDMILLPGNKAELKNFVILNEEMDIEPITVPLGKQVKVPFGAIYISPTPNYSVEYLNQDIHVTKNDVQRVAAAFSKSMTISLGDKEATILDFVFNDENIQRADDILNTLIAIYNENWIKDKNLLAISTSKFITERLEMIEKELGHVDENISDFKSRNLLPDVEAVSRMYMDQSSKNIEQLLSLNNQLSMARFIRDYLNDATKKNMLLPVNSGIESNSIESQIIEYNTMLLERNRLVSNSSEKNPLVIDMDHSLASMRSAIVRSLNNQVSLLNTQIGNYRETESKTNERIASSPRQAKQLLSVERQQKVKEALYIFLLQKREENELSKAYTAYNSRMIQPPSGSPRPTSPKKGIILLAAFALGILIPGGIIFMLESLNTTVRGRKDLAILTIPFIGEIPVAFPRKRKLLFAKKEPEVRRIVVEDNNRDIINEAFRVLRTKLDYFKGSIDKSQKIFMMTSFNPGSGKTFITMNLAVSIALKGKKVLTIDMDIRRASLSTFIRSPKKGITTYLSGHVDDIHDVMVHKMDNLDMIPVGIIPPNPTELLLNGRMQAALEQLREEYDYILLDCPPVEIVADASIIAEMVDYTLFVIRVGIMDRRMLKDVEDIYREGKYKNMAVILNGSKYVSSKYGHYRYGYNYGYGGYGYGGYGHK